MSVNSPTPSPLFDRKLNTGIATPAPFHVLLGRSVNPSFTMVSLLALGASCKIRLFPFSKATNDFLEVSYIPYL